MRREVFIDETIHDERRTNEYVPISVKLYEKGEDGYKDTKFPWFRTSVRGVKKGTPIYIVTFIQHSGKDQDTKSFDSESRARKYIDNLAKAIEMKQKVIEVNVHYKTGLKNLRKLLDQIPINSYVSFRTPNDEFSVTLARGTY